MDKDKNVKDNKSVYCLDMDKSFFNHQDSLCRRKVDFDLAITNSTRQIIEYKNGKRQMSYVYSKSHYSFKEINMFRKLKKEVHRNIVERKLDVPDCDVKDVDFFRYSDIIRAVRPNEIITLGRCLELDIKMAYYFTAHELGYIGDIFYDECKLLPKLQRLRLIGSMATDKEIYRFRGGKLVDVVNEKDELLRCVWFHICRQVDQCMQEFSYFLRERFLFYWVDGIYMTGSRLPDSIVYISTKHKYRFEPTKINKIDIICDSNENILMNIYKDKVIKPFNVNKNTERYKQSLLEKYRHILEQEREVNYEKATEPEANSGENRGDKTS